MPKVLIKKFLLSKLHAVPKRQLDIANNVINVGVPQILSFKYSDFKDEILAYVDSLKIGDFKYKYAKSRKTTTLYASIYACMLYGLLEEMDQFSEQEKKDWADYFNSFQNEKDGFFYDPGLLGEAFNGNGDWGDGWGKRHLAGHIIIAFIRLGHTPKYAFNFLEDYYHSEYLNKWLNHLFATENMWSASNYIMNIVTLLQYSRDYMNDTKSNSSIEFILSWLDRKQDKETGLWHVTPLKTERELHTAIRGAYHYYPLFIYDDKTINFQEKVIDLILKTQNSWGGFEEELHPSGACEDIDALDPLIRFTLNTKHRKAEVDIAVKKALYWVMSNRNNDGGFSFMPLTPHEYGAHQATTSHANESNLMATWFRTLCLAYMLKYLRIDNQFTLITSPGYEIPL